MQRFKSFAIGAAGFVFLMLVGSLLHLPQWVAKAAGIFASPVSNIQEAYQVPYQSTALVNASSCELPATCEWSFTAPPQGYRLVLQQISINAVTTNNAVVEAHLQAGTTLLFADVESTVFGLYSVTKPLAAYVDPGVPPHFDISISGSAAFQENLLVTVTGYLQNCSAFPGGTCPAVVN
jgi:hypothetical protein